MRFSKVLWYIHRLQAMSLPEIWHRLREWAIIQRERIQKPCLVEIDRENLARGWKVFRAEEDAHFFFGRHNRNTAISQYKRLFPESRVATFQKASALMQHEFCIFDHLVSFGPNIPWNRDPLTGRDWPTTYWADIDIRDGQAIGGVKWVWELNRHHHLVTLGKAYFLSGEERYAQEVCAQLESWIQSNPPYTGVNWTSALELAIRLINWVWALAFVRSSPTLTPTLFQTIIESIVAQACHISRHLSNYSSANNHLIGEAAGLAIVGLMFPWLPSANKWCDLGLEILAQEIGKQIYPDGTPAEQSLHYLAFILDFNLLAWRLAELNDISPPTIWYERLGAACDFLSCVMDERGNVPAIGDSDDAWVVRLDDRSDANNYRSILATAAVLLERPGFKVYAGRWDEKSHWLLGETGRAVFEALPDHPVKRASCVFETGGYCVMRSSGCVITFDCGSLGYLSTAAHGHADALSLTVSVDGVPLLLDPGTYAYQEGGGKRDFFRSTAAHNTLVVDGENQSEILGVFLWGRKANGRLLCWESTEDYDLAIAEHDGYQPRGVMHRRTILFYKPSWLIVADYLVGEGEHVIEQLWHLPPDGRAKVEQDGINQQCVVLRVEHHQSVLVPIEIPPAVRVEIQVGEEKPLQGWTSLRYGRIEPSPVVNLTGTCQLPIRLVTALHLTSISNQVDLSTLKAEVVAIWAHFAHEVEAFR